MLLRQSRSTRSAVVFVLAVATAASGVAGATADGLPRGRNKPVFAFDPTRRTLVLFGGFGDGAGVLHDGWERAAEGWQGIERSAFPPRAAAGVATDTRRGRVVLFGGEDQAGVCGDTLEWDGTAWKRVAWSGPPARTVPQLAYDSKRDRTVLFGGSDGKQTTFGDTWEWDGTQWTKMADSGPPPRYQHVLTYDAARGRVVLFGGHPGGPYDPAAWSKKVLGDTWAWDGARWTQAAGAGPSARDHHAMTYDESRAKVVLFGGWDGKFLADLWEWDGAWKRIEAQGPSARGGLPSLRYHPLWQTVVLYGGWGPRGAETDTWKWDGRTWTLVDPARRTTRVDPLAALRHE